MKVNNRFIEMLILALCVAPLAMASGPYKIPCGTNYSHKISLSEHHQIMNQCKNETCKTLCGPGTYWTVSDDFQATPEDPYMGYSGIKCQCYAINSNPLDETVKGPWECAYDYLLVEWGGYDISKPTYHKEIFDYKVLGRGNSQTEARLDAHSKCGNPDLDKPYCRLTHAWPNEYTLCSRNACREAGCRNLGQ